MITYQDCADALLKMWMDDVLTDAEYNRIMDKLNNAQRKDEPQTDEPTWEQVKEYCNKRCLDIVDSALRGKWYKEEPHIVGKHADVIIIDEPQTDCAWGRDK